MWTGEDRRLSHRGLAVLPGSTQAPGFEMAPAPSDLRREVLATVRLAGPLVGGQLAYAGLGFIDTAMSGRLGASTLASVAVGVSLWVSVHYFVFGVLMAVPPSVSHLDGAGRADEAGPLGRQALWLSQGCALLTLLLISHPRPLLAWLEVEPSIVPTVEGYLGALRWGVPALYAYLVLRFLAEGLGVTRPVLYLGVAALPVNALGNWVLMYGKLGLPALGAVGCGLATALVWWVQLLGMLLYFSRQPRLRGLQLFARFEPPRRRPIGGLLRLGMPIGATTVLEVAFFALSGLLIGSLGAVPVAGHQVALSFAATTFMISFGVAMATTVRVGHALGRGEPAAASRAARIGIGLALAAQALAAAVMLLVPERVASLYTRDPAVAGVAVRLLFFAALFQVFDALQASCAGALRGFKDTRAPMVITLVSYWLLGLPVGLALAFRAGMGAEGIWTGMIAALTAAGLLLLARVVRVSRRAG
jgi:MATE family multidrug resistance protein